MSEREEAFGQEPDAETRSANAETRTSIEILRSDWPKLSPEEQQQAFVALDHAEAVDLFLALHAHEQVALLLSKPPSERRLWARLLPLDDLTDLIQALPEEEVEAVVAALDERARAQVKALMAYAEDDAGGLMNPRYAVLRPDLTVDQALTYLRRQERDRDETIYYTYVLDSEHRLVGVVSLRDLMRAPTTRLVRDVMKSPVSVPPDLDQEELARRIAHYNLLAMPVVDAQGRMQGIVTIDDVLDVVNEEATEDIHKLGGIQALEQGYLEVGLLELLRKRAGWLTLLFVGEMLTATAMGYFEDEIAKAIVLALFIPLIISSGGNSGSQASTLIVRALAVGDVRLGDWWRVFRREFLSGLALGSLLALIGFARILLWPSRATLYGPHYALVGLTVSLSLVGVVMWGTLSGSMLPLVLHRLGFDPATASAPFVATLVDVTGLVIYFTVASIVLSGTLL